MKDKKKQDKDGFRLNETGVYIYGQRMVIVDGHAEIHEYSDDRVIFRLEKKNKYLTVCGKALTVRVAGLFVSEVSGHVDKVEYENGDVKC